MLTQEKLNWLADFGVSPELLGKVAVSDESAPPAGLSPSGGQGINLETGAAFSRAPTGNASAAPGSGGPVKTQIEVEVVTTKFPPISTDWGDIEASATIKTTPTLTGVGSKDPIRSETTRTSKDKGSSRETGVKQRFSYNSIKDIEFAKGFSLADLSVGMEFELSGVEITAAANLKFTLVTPYLGKTPASFKLIVIKAKEGEGIKGPGAEFKMAPVQVQIKLGTHEVAASVEYKIAFNVNKKKIGTEVLKQVAKRELIKEAKKQGVKYLGRAAAETVLKRLGPLAAAFGVGLDIGELLNQYTIAPEVAGVVIDEIMGDFAERYNEAGTLGKIWLVSKNSPRIVAALVAAGVTGAFAGMTDLVLFKLLGLDRLRDFRVALDAFAELSKLIDFSGLGDMMVYGAFMVGIKLDPANHKVKQNALAQLAVDCHAVIKPMFKSKNGINALLSAEISAANVAPAVLQQAAALIAASKLTFEGADGASTPEEVLDALMYLTIPGYMRFLESSGLISYSFSMPAEMSVDAIDPKLLDALFK
jgi:hypothetical protein